MMESQLGADSGHSLLNGSPIYRKTSFEDVDDGKTPQSV